MSSENGHADGWQQLPSGALVKTSGTVSASSGQTERVTLTIPEAAKLAGFSKDSLYSAARSGELRVVRAGRSMRVTRACLDAWLNQGLNSGRGQPPGSTPSGGPESVPTAEEVERLAHGLLHLATTVDPALAERCGAAAAQLILVVNGLKAQPSRPRWLPESARVR